MFSPPSWAVSERGDPGVLELPSDPAARALPEVSIMAQAALRSLAHPLGGSERHAAFMALRRAATRYRNGSMARADVTLPAGVALPLLRETRDAVWYLTECAHSLLGTDQADLDVVCDNAADVAHHATFLALTAEILRPRRWLGRRTSVDRFDVLGRWEQARALCAVKQRPDRVTVRMPLLGRASSAAL